jgi:hypothetical protein
MPYVVPNRMQPEGKLPTTLTPTFWAPLAIVPFDTLDPVQSKVIPDDDIPASAQVSASSQEYINTILPPYKSVDPPHVQHKCFFFDDGNITFLVRLVHLDTCMYKLDEQYI